jgi:5-methylcytosine-specific restriction enzyme A
MRAELFKREPLCRACMAEGRTTLATIRDHIKPLFEGGTDDPTNIQPLCQACSDLKTAAESSRGRGGPENLRRQ